MQIEVRIDEAAKDTTVIIVTPRMGESVSELIKRISEERPQVIAGFRDGTVCLLEQAEIYRIYAQDGKVFCKTQTGIWNLRLRLYELEERLDGRRFARISNSEIINLHRVKNFDLSYVGTICVTMKDGDTSYVSRRYVSRIKKALGI